MNIINILWSVGGILYTVYTNTGLYKYRFISTGKRYKNDVIWKGGLETGGLVSKA